MTPRRISIFLPRRNVFYENLLAQMIRGFEECGVECTGATQLLNAEEMKQWCGKHRPQVVFEMNRSRNQVPYLPSDVRHISWVVDLQGKMVTEYLESDIQYFFGCQWTFGYPDKGFSRCFVPGSCPVDYPSNPEPNKKYDLSFVGHIPQPWSDEELARELTGGAANLSFGEFVREFEHKLRLSWNPPVDKLAKRRTAGDSPWDPINVAKTLVQEMSGHPLVIADDKLLYDIRGRCTRHINRCDLANGMVDTNKKVAFFGPENWNKWDRFSGAYQGWLNGPEELRKAYAQSRFNLHEGEGIHFRSVDIMASGGVLLFRRNRRDVLPGGIQAMFDPGEHYIPFDLETMSETVETIEADPSALEKIGQQAAKEIRARHTWRHRALETLRDLDAVG